MWGIKVILNYVFDKQESKNHNSLCDLISFCYIVVKPIMLNLSKNNEKVTF